MPQTPAPGAILIVEDHELTVTMLTELLAKAFPSQPIHVARDAREALLKVAEVAPAVIVMDIDLPDGSGLDLAQMIAARARHVNIVMHSIHDSTVFREASLNVGARAFVSKNNVGDLVPVLGTFIACST